MKGQLRINYLQTAFGHCVLRMLKLYFLLCQEVLLNSWTGYVSSLHLNLPSKVGDSFTPFYFIFFKKILFYLQCSSRAFSVQLPVQLLYIKCSERRGSLAIKGMHIIIKYHLKMLIA